MLRSDFCDFSDAYIVVKGIVTVTNPNNAKWNKSIAFKNNAPFINHISKINGVETDNAENLDVVILMYNSLEYSKNYRKATGSLWNYYRNEPSNPFSSNSESFKYKTSIQEVAIPLKYWSNFWRILNIPLINCEVELILTWSKNCVLADMTAKAAGNNNVPPAVVAPTGLEFQI